MDELINNIMQSPENTNPNVLRGQLEKIAGSGGGMPDASGFKDGTAMVAVGGKFVPVEGYGYSVIKSSYGPFYWDGVYHEDDPDAFYQGDGGYYVIFKKIADDSQIISIESSIHILEDGNEYTLSYQDTGVSSALLFVDDVNGHMLIVIKDPSAWDDLGVESRGTGVFVYTYSATEPQDEGLVAKPAEYTIVNGSMIGTFNKKYIPSVIDIKIVQSLPDTGESGIIYMVSDYSDSEDRFSEYIWDSQNRNYEMLGHRRLDLTNYVTNTQLNNRGFVTSAQVDSKLNAKIVTGTTEYEDGVTDLANGVIYLQYEV